MSFIGLTAYSVRIREKNPKKKQPYADLSAFDGKTDFLDFLHKLLKAAGIKPVATAPTKHFEPTGLNKSAKTLHGLIEVGNSGYGSKIKDLKAGTTDFNRKSNHSEFIPLFFRYNSDTNRPDFAFLTLQNFEHSGLATILNEYVRLNFKKSFPDYTLYIQRVLVPQVAQKLLSSSDITKARWIRREVPKDIADKFGAKTTETGEIELVLKSSGGNPFGIKRRLKDFFSSKSTMGELLEVDEVAYDELKLEVKIAGRSRTIAMSRMDNLRQTLDISTDVKLTAEGHPQIDSINSIAAKYEADLLQNGAT